MSERRHTVFLTGDQPLIVELGEACHESGMTVVGRLNAPGKLPGFFRNRKGTRVGVAVGVELTTSDRERKKKNLRYLEGMVRGMILSSSVAVTITEQSRWVRRPSRLLGISALPTLLSGKLVEIAPSRQSDRVLVEEARDFFSHLGKEIAVVQDRVGMVMPRILCSLINEAFFALMESVASPQDIDAAMKLGTGYPRGPLEWADRIGVAAVVEVLTAIRDDIGEDRYRIAPLLNQMALSPGWWHT